MAIRLNAHGPCLADLTDAVLQARASATPKPAALPPLTEAEVVACLRRHGGLTTAELTEKLQVRLAPMHQCSARAAVFIMHDLNLVCCVQVKARSEADKKAFMGLVKAVARLELRDGKKLVVLK